MDKHLIIRNFSRYANVYDRYADVQKLSALKLAGAIKEDNFRNILEIGCGTGNYTFALRQKFGRAKIKALDLSAEMLRAAAVKFKGNSVEFVLADAEEVDFNEEFDLVTSNACFQWFEDLEKALLKYSRSLKKGGQIYFSMFGPRTFWELGASLKRIFKGSSVGAEKFMAQEKIRMAVSKNFRKAKVVEFSYRESFTRLQDLLKKIKYTGTRGNVPENSILFNRHSLREVERVYRDRFKGIRATYQVFFCRGIR